MKLKFVDQPYQTDAVNSICDIFDGSEAKDSLFTIDARQGIAMDFDQEGVTYFLGHANKLTISDSDMLDK